MNTYRKALPLLLEDFSDRCAYSLVHIKMIGEKEMHVDHHDPRIKNRSPYENLFPAYGPCNEAKRDTWPHASLHRQGMRFLNPCKETDYGKQIFEDPQTHELVGTTPAARYHIDILDLNHPTLTLQRRERSRLREIANSPVIAKKPIDGETQMITDKILEMLSYKIPPIPPPPPA